MKIKVLPFFVIVLSAAVLLGGCQQNKPTAFTDLELKEKCAQFIGRARNRWEDVLLYLSDYATG